MQAVVASLVVSQPQGAAGLFFFFQAEDGIRGSTVTGVQTFSLPILCDAVVRRLGQRSGCPPERPVPWPVPLRNERPQPGHAGRRRWAERGTAAPRACLPL